MTHIDIQFHNVCTIEKINSMKNIKVYKDNSNSDRIYDSCSILEYIRSKQLSDILGKYKLF